MEEAATANKPKLAIYAPNEWRPIIAVRERAFHGRPITTLSSNRPPTSPVPGGRTAVSLGRKGWVILEKGVLANDPAVLVAGVPLDSQPASSRKLWAVRTEGP